MTINIVNLVGPPIALEPKAEQPQDPSSLVQGSQDPSLSEQPQGPSSLEYITLREMLADLVDLLAGNAPVITQLNNHLFSPGLIPEAVHIAVNTIALSPHDRANNLINAVLATVECHPNPNTAFASLITALHKVGLNNIATKLMECFSKCMHHCLILLLSLIGKKSDHIDINLEQTRALNDQPFQVADTSTATQPPTLSQTQSSSFTIPKLSSKTEVASNIGNLHSPFASLDSKQRDEFDELVEKGQV